MLQYQYLNKKDDIAFRINNIDTINRNSTLKKLYVHVNKAVKKNRKRKHVKK